MTLDAIGRDDDDMTYRTRGKNTEEGPCCDEGDLKSKERGEGKLM